MNKGTHELIQQITNERELRFEQPTAHLRVGIVTSVDAEHRPTVSVSGSTLPHLMTTVPVLGGDRVLVLMAGHLAVVLALAHTGPIAFGSGAPVLPGAVGGSGVRGSVWSHGLITPGMPDVPPGGWLPGDQWMSSRTGELFLFTDARKWTDEGVSLKGPKGDIGPEGPRGNHGFVGSRGSWWTHGTGTPGTGSTPPGGHWHVGDQWMNEANGELFIVTSISTSGVPTWTDEGISLIGPQGVRGPRGLGIEFEGAKANEAAIRALVNPELGEVHLDVATGNLWVFDDIHPPHDDKTRATWHAVGHVQGPPGSDGAAGPRGGAGSPGLRGSVWTHSAVVPNAPTAATVNPPPDVSGWHKGDQWLHEATGELWMYNGTAWSDEGVSIKGIRGLKGPKGDRGTHGGPGVAGPRGRTGATGHVGGRGPAGPAGGTGPRGPAGAVSWSTADRRYIRIGGAAAKAHTHPYLPIAGGRVTHATHLGFFQVRNVWIGSATPRFPAQGDIWMH